MAFNQHLRFSAFHYLLDLNAVAFSFCLQVFITSPPDILIELIGIRPTFRVFSLPLPCASDLTEVAFASACRCWTAMTGRYKHKWLVLKETCLFLLTPETGELRTVMLMDSNFEVSHGYRITGVRNALLISNLSR